MTELLYYFETGLDKDKATHQAEVVSETEKTYVIRAEGIERTVRKSWMSHSDIGGSFYFFKSFGECEEAHQAYLKRSAEWCETQAKRLLAEAENYRNYIWPEKETE